MGAARENAKSHNVSGRSAVACTKSGQLSIE